MGDACDSCPEVSNPTQVQGAAGAGWGPGGRWEVSAPLFRYKEVASTGARLSDRRRQRPGGGRVRHRRRQVGPGPRGGGLAGVPAPRPRAPFSLGSALTLLAEPVIPSLPCALTAEPPTWPPTWPPAGGLAEWRARLTPQQGAREGCGTFRAFIWCLFFCAAMGMDIRTPRTTVHSSPTALSWTQTMTDLEMSAMGTMTMMVSQTTCLPVLITAAWYPTPTRRTQMVRLRPQRVGPVQALLRGRRQALLRGGQWVRSAGPEGRCYRIVAVAGALAPRLSGQATALVMCARMTLTMTRWPTPWMCAPKVQR